MLQAEINKDNGLQYFNLVITTGLTLAKSGGGFFPRHRFDRAHTALRVVVRRLDLASSLDMTKKDPDVITYNTFKQTGNTQRPLTAVEMAGYHS